MCGLNGSVRDRVSSMRTRFWTLPMVKLAVSNVYWTLPMVNSTVSNVYLLMVIHN